MRTQLQAISLRIQTVRSNEQMMQAMKGATSLLGSMNRQMNLPALQRIAMEFERENDIMDQRQEMMDDAIDDVTGLEDEEEEDEVVNQILDELGIDLGQAVGLVLPGKMSADAGSWERRRRACTGRPLRRAESRRRSVLATPRTTICRRDWTAFGDEALVTEFGVSVITRHAFNDERMRLKVIGIDLDKAVCQPFTLHLQTPLDCVLPRPLLFCTCMEAQIAKGEI
jgi:Snf7